MDALQNSFIAGVAVLFVRAPCADCQPCAGGFKHSALDAPLFYEILLGELTAREKEPGTAFSLMLDAARKTKDPAVFRRAVQIALQARSGESALQAAKAWSQALPNSREASYFTLQILLGLNRAADTLEPLKRGIQLTPAKERRDFIWSLPPNFERAGSRQLAAAVFQKAMDGWVNDPSVGATAWAASGRVWLAAEDKTRALEAATKGMAADSRSEHAALLALSMMATDAPKAEALVKNTYLTRVQSSAWPTSKPCSGANVKTMPSASCRRLSLRRPITPMSG